MIFGDSGLRQSDGAYFSVWTGAGRQRQDVGDAGLEELRPALAQLWLREENINDNVRLADWLRNWPPTPSQTTAWRHCK